MMLEKTRSRSRLRKIKKPPKKQKQIPKRSKFHAQADQTKIYRKRRLQKDVEIYARAARARRMASPTVSEDMCAEILREEGYGFEREKIIHTPTSFLMLDFYLEKFLLGIEVDGGAHIGTGRFDAGRDRWLRSRGITTLRIKNEEFKDKEAVKAKIREAISGIS